LEEKAAKERVVYTEAQLQALEVAKRENPYGDLYRRQKALY
jgi:hypothetical protein